MWRETTILVTSKILNIFTWESLVNANDYYAITIYNYAGNFYTFKWDVKRT